MAEDHRVSLRIDDQIAYVELNRPNKRNAFDLKMFDAVTQTIKSLRKDRSIRAVIVTGAGEDFCSGLDVKSVMGSKTGVLKLLFKLWPWGSNLAQRVSTGWRRVPAPVIMAIHGRCWGAGLQVALGADFRIATADASLSIMEGRWGLIPDMGGTLALREHCRQDVAKKLAMTAEEVSGEKGLEMGLVTHLAADPLAQAQSMADEFKTLSPDAVAGVKKLFNKSWHGNAGMALLRESWYQIRAIVSKNSRIKVWNQTHGKDEQKPFVNRKRW